MREIDFGVEIPGTRRLFPATDMPQRQIVEGRGRGPNDVRRHDRGSGWPACLLTRTGLQTNGGGSRTRARSGMGT